VEPHAASLCVLASGSAGNCSVLLLPGHDGRASSARIVLIDAGLSPRRTRKNLEALGFTLDHVDAVLLTHLDHDHWHGGWLKALPDSAVIFAHKRHATRGRRTGQLPARCEAFESTFSLPSGQRTSAVLASHDDLGVASFRFELPPTTPSPTDPSAPAPGEAPRAAVLGFATDLGRVRYELLEHLRGVDVLAIESNYCPGLQAASDRPWFLKRRITGGSGHLSNFEAIDAIREIRPREHVILLHLSRECNCPNLVAQLHAGAPYRCTITSQIEPTPWIPIRPARCTGPSAPAEPPMVQMPLFGPPPVVTRTSLQAAQAGSMGAA
jgi:phosphoribosyl 1,2-cyclic phosphodiesterase